MRLVAAPLVVTALSLTGCPPEEDPDDDVPPRVVGVEPVAPIVPVTTTFTVQFSEELNDDTIDAEVASDTLTIVLAPRFDGDGELLVDEDFLADLANPGLSVSRQDDVVPVIVSLVDGDEAITVAPRAPLEPGVAYSLIVSGEVRDTAGNPLVDASGVKAAFIWEFTTDAGPPAVRETDVGGVVVPNRKRITVEFNQPVVGVSQDTLFIDGSPAPTVEAILVDEDRRTATIVLADPAAGCERFAAGGSYTLTATAGILGDTGQALAPYSEPFTVDDTCDTAVNLMSNVERIASDVSATVRFTTTKPSTTEVRYGRAGGPLDCEGGPCPVVGAPTTTANAVHTVTLSGLTVNVDYEFVAFAEDQVGTVATGTGSFRTEPLPKVSVNEALQDADNDVFDSDPAGEFVELASFEEAITTSLTGWSLRVTKASGGAPNECAIPAGVELPAGGFLVLADDSFVESGYDIPASAGLVKFAGFCGLQNEALTIELLDPSGRPVSSLTTPAPDPGQSIERRDPAGPDDDTNVCPSRADTGPTPGRENGARLGCDE